MSGSEEDAIEGVGVVNGVGMGEGEEATEGEGEGGVDEEGGGGGGEEELEGELGFTGARFADELGEGAAGEAAMEEAVEDGATEGELFGWEVERVLGSEHRHGHGFILVFVLVVVVEHLGGGIVFVFFGDFFGFFPRSFDLKMKRNDGAELFLVF